MNKLMNVEPEDKPWISRTSPSQDEQRVPSLLTLMKDDHLNAMLQIFCQVHCSHVSETNPCLGPCSLFTDALC